MYRLIVWLSVLALLGCGDAATEPPEPTWFDEPDAELPPQISEFGTFDGPRLRDGAPLETYEPAYPLWSAGASKSRLAFVPEGEVIDNGDAEGGWHAPPGTVFFKTFEWQGEPVETRVMRRLEGDWEFAAYLWNEEGTDAERLEMRRSTPVEVTWKGTTFEHRVPNENDCRKCHEPTDGMLLGFNELQLGEQVEDLAAAGILERGLSENPPQLGGETELENEVLAGFVGNCVNCHNGSEHDQSSFDLSPGVAFANTIGQSTESSASASGTRVVPGRPDESILWLAISGESDDPELKEMPPVGLELRDEEFVEAVRRWIEGLPGN